MISGSARLTHAIRDLRTKWDETRAFWADQVAADFEKTHMDPLSAQCESTARGMSELGEVLGKVKRDCSDREEY